MNTFCNENPSFSHHPETGLSTFLWICQWDQGNTINSFFVSLYLKNFISCICFTICIELLISDTSASKEWINKAKWAEWVVWRVVWNLLEKSFRSCLRQQRKLRKISCILIEMFSASFRSVCSASPILPTWKWESLQFLPGSCAAVH